MNPEFFSFAWRPKPRLMLITGKEKRRTEMLTRNLWEFFAKLLFFMLLSEHAIDPKTRKKSESEQKKSFNDSKGATRALQPN